MKSMLSTMMERRGNGCKVVIYVEGGGREKRAPVCEKRDQLGGKLDRAWRGAPMSRIKRDGRNPRLKVAPVGPAQARRNNNLIFYVCIFLLSFFTFVYISKYSK
jgi:hypothetical protein